MSHGMWVIVSWIIGTYIGWIIGYFIYVKPKKKRDMSIRELHEYFDR